MPSQVMGPQGAPADAVAPRWIARAAVAALLLLPVAGMLVPTGLLERAPSICLFRLAFGIRCWGCGMTRAISSVLHGEVRRAIDFNWRVVVVFPILTFVWAAALLRAWKEAALRHRH